MDEEIKNTELNIRIGHLVLDGISLTYYQQQQVKEIVEVQLKKMFSENGLPSKLETVRATVKSQVIHLNQQPSAHHLGKQIATSIYKGLSNTIENNSKKNINVQ
jgi:hypothetical protein